MKYRKYFLVFIAFLILNSVVVCVLAAGNAARTEETVSIKNVAYRCSNGAIGSIEATDYLTAALSADFSMPDAWVEYTFVIYNGASSSAKFSDIQIELPQNVSFDIDAGEISNYIGNSIPEGSYCTIKATLTAKDSGSFLFLNNEPIQMRFVFEGDTISGSTNNGDRAPSPQTGGNSNTVLAAVIALLSFCSIIVFGSRVRRNTKVSEDSHGNKEHL